MRIMQVNCYTPIRQNRMTFRGEETKPAEKKAEKPLLQQLAELKESLKTGITWEKAKSECTRIYSLAEEKLTTGTASQDDAKALTETGETLVQVILSELHDLMNENQRKAIIDQANAVCKAIDGIIPLVYSKSNGEISILNTTHRIISQHLGF